MKLWRLVCAGWLLLVLAACGGGGGDAGTSLFGGDTTGGNTGGGTTATGTASDLVLVLDRSTVDNSGAQLVTATITAVDGNRATVANVPVQVSVDNGAFVSVSANATGATGQVTATVSIGGNQALRTINVTARASGLATSRSFQVVGGSTTGGIAASDLVVVLDRTTVGNSGTQTVLATVTALDGNRNALAGVPVAVTVDNGAFATVSGATTSSTGVVTANVSIGSNKTPRAITVTATAAGATGSISRADAFSVTAEAGGGSAVASDLVVVLDKTSIDNSGTQSVTATITAVDANRATLAGIPVTVKVNNNAVVSVSSSTTNAAGIVTATITAGNDKTLRTVDVTASTDTLGRVQSFQVVGSAGGGGIAASDLVVVLDRTTLPNSGTEKVVATVTALDANRNALAGAPVQVTVDAEAIATVSGALTGADGVVTADVTIGANKTQRNVTVTARSGAIVKTQVFQVTVAAGGGGSVTAADLIILVSKPLIDSNGVDSATVTVTALDANRNAISGVPVVVTVDNNAVATVNAGSTNTSGVVTASVTAGADRSNRNVVVTATAGAISRTATLTVTAGGGTVTPEDMTLELSAAQVANTGTDSVIATVTTVDARRNSLPGVQVRYSIDSGGVIVPGGLTTGSDGRLIATARIGADRSTRTITVTATAGNLTKTASFLVFGARFTSTAVPAVAPPLSTGNQIQYRLVDNNANPMVGLPITVTSSLGTSLSGRTGPNGEFSFPYVAPATGPIVFTASAAGESDTRTVSVSSGTAVVPLPPPGTQVLSFSVSTSPSVVSVNTAGASSNQAALRALVVGPDNRPIENVRVRFDIPGVTTPADKATRGQIDVDVNTVYTGPDGVASANYIAGTTASPTNGTPVRACYSLTDVFDCSNPANLAQTTLTVVQEALSVAVGTDELIQEGAGTYIKDYVVMVVDAAGQAKADITISASVDLTAYYKGFYQVSGDRWTQFITLAQTEGYTWSAQPPRWNQTGAPLGTQAQGIGFTDQNGITVYRQPSCPNEDNNHNGILETGEDMNGNLELDPRKAIASIRVVGSNKTAANGTAILRLEYPRDYATWADFEIIVQAAGVSGTEGRARYVGTLFGRGNLPAPAAVLTNRQASPAFVFSPYGRSPSCLDAR